MLCNSLLPSFPLNLVKKQQEIFNRVGKRVLSFSFWVVPSVQYLLDLWKLIQREDMEVEDDLFFADLSRQISLLIMDDDEDTHPVVHLHTPSVSLQGLCQTVHPPVQTPLLHDYEQVFIRESKGTGVFIPARSPQPRRKQRHGSFNTSSRRIKSEDRKLNSQVSSTHYFKPKKI